MPRASDSLTEYDIACGRSIDAAFASFQGMDLGPSQWLVFAALVHRMTGGRDDGTHNPLSLEGAGWPGLVGLADGRRGAGPAFGTASFATLPDGCLAAGVSLQFPEFRAVQAAYRTGQPILLAGSIEVSPLATSPAVAGLAADVTALSQRNAAFTAGWERPIAPTRARARTRGPTRAKLGVVAGGSSRTAGASGT